MLKGIIRTAFSTLSTPSLGVDILLAVPRIWAGWMLSFRIGCNKFGVPWTPSEKELGFFEVSPGFVEYIAKMDLFAWAPLFFAWMAGFSETICSLLMALGF